jgi:glycosyltransferase involved in cell wall biosynthesis
MRRLAIITTHPIQYYAPLFRLLDERGVLAVRVFYTWEKDAAGFDKDFGKEIKWDIPLLDGYDFRFVSNNGSARRDFRGVRNPRLVQEIEEWGADAILVFGWNYHSHLKAIRTFKDRIPVLFRGDSTLLDERPGLKRLARRHFLKWVYRQVDAALYVGARNKDYFLAHGLREDQLIFAGHAIDNRRFADPDGGHAANARRYREEMGIGESDTVFLFVGKFQVQKDPFLLVRAFRQLGHPHVHLVLVGNGNLEEELRREAGGQSTIHFLPFQNQSAMPAVYRIGQVFCLPSQSETWGLSVNEAMACGVPVLVSDRCGCAEDLAIAGQNGHQFRSGDEQALLGALKRMLDPSVDLPGMGQRSLELIRDWSFDRIASAIELTTERLVSSRIKQSSE